MNKCCISVLCLASLMLFSGCDESKQNPNVMFSEKHQDPIQELEKRSKKVDHSQFGYKQTFYVPITQIFIPIGIIVRFYYQQL